MLPGLFELEIELVENQIHLKQMREVTGFFQLLHIHSHADGGGLKFLWLIFAAVLNHLPGWSTYGPITTVAVCISIKPC